MKKNIKKLGKLVQKGTTCSTVSKITNEDIFDKSFDNSEKAVVTCLNINCPERRSLCCNALSTTTSSVIRGDYFVCKECGLEFRSGKCNVMDGEAHKVSEF